MHLYHLLKFQNFMKRRSAILELLRKEAVVAYFKILSDLLCGVTEENISQDSRLSGRESKLGIPITKHECRLLS
jgi:hypothetical protein